MHVGEIGMAEAEDQEILAYASQNGWVIMAAGMAGSRVSLLEKAPSLVRAKIQKYQEEP